MSEHYDVIIIGSGAGGGTLAHTLARSGKQILLLERGTFLPREMDNWDPEPVFIDGKYISPDTWYDADGKAFQPQVHYYVGGATKLYGAALYRLRAAGLRRAPPRGRPLTRLAARGTTRWNRGTRERSGCTRCTAMRGEDPTEGHRSQPYPWPALSHEPRIQQLSDDLTAGGYHPFHAPCGVMLDEADRARSACIRCTWCDGYPCLVHAKSDAETIAVRPILDLPNVTLLVGAEVTNWRPTPAGASSPGSSSRATAPPRSIAATSSSVSAGAVQLGEAAVALGERCTPGRLGERIRPGRSQLHVPQLQGRRRPGQGTQRHGVPEDDRDQRLLLRCPWLRLARRATSR